VLGLEIVSGEIDFPFIIIRRRLNIPLGFEKQTRNFFNQPLPVFAGGVSVLTSLFIT